mgnify:CR=1 FL=1
MLPPSPLLDVDADMVMSSAIVRFLVLTWSWPALPVPSVSTVILPFPIMFMVSGANKLMLPPLPLDVVRADMKPLFLCILTNGE